MYRISGEKERIKREWNSLLVWLRVHDNTTTPHVWRGTSEVKNTAGRSTDAQSAVLSDRIKLVGSRDWLPRVMHWLFGIFAIQSHRMGILPENSASASLGSIQVIRWNPTYVWWQVICSVADDSRRNASRRISNQQWCGLRSLVSGIFLVRAWMPTAKIYAGNFLCLKSISRELGSSQDRFQSRRPSVMMVNSSRSSFW